MSQILKRPRAKADLAEIWDYIAEDSESRADAFIETMGGNYRHLRIIQALVGRGIFWERVSGVFL